MNHIDQNRNLLFKSAGRETLTKADRWVLKFLERAMQRTPRVGEALALLTEASYLLTPQYSYLTRRYLDNQIRSIERMRGE